MLIAEQQNTILLFVVLIAEQQNTNDSYASRAKPFQYRRDALDFLEIENSPEATH